MHDATKVIRAGLPDPQQGAPFTPGPVFAATYHLAGDPTPLSQSYGRFSNPTWTHFEQALSDLEGGDALVFSSGMAAVAAVFGAVLRPGDVVVLPADSYYTVRNVTAGYFAQMGVTARLAATADDAQLAHLDGAKLLWIESPSNPMLDVCDIPRLVAAAHERGVLVAVDNTTPTVLGQRPLALGADFSVAADTKALTGHSDVLLGHVATRDPGLMALVRTWRTQIGAIPGAMEVWLAHRSLATLHLRLEKQATNALSLAAFLAQQPAVSGLRYPGLPSDPAYAIASRQMRYFGPVVSFTLPDRARAERFLGACRLIYEATSFGGLHTSAERRARWGGDAVPEGFIRLSVGCEDPADLIEDLAGALAAL
jgi:cystathionine gamma-lyase